MTDDPFDPRQWPVVDDHEYRIYGDDNAQTWAVVDAAFYPHLVRFRWSPKASRGGRKIYLRRTLHSGTREARVTRCFYLHQAVMRLAGVVAPSLLHEVIDHIDGDAMNNRLSNLRWATHSENRVNIINRELQDA